MLVNKVSSRYAKSLISLAMEQGVLENVRQDMEVIANICLESKELVVVLKSPVIKTHKKEAILKAIFGATLSKMTNDFIDILVRKGRERHLPGIAQAFVEHYDRQKGIAKADITTAVALDDETRAAIKDLVSSMGNHNEIVLNEKVNEEIIGGFIARLDDKQVDASVTRRLEELKKELNENPYIAEF